jgi:hypothetical protein
MTLLPLIVLVVQYQQPSDWCVGTTVAPDRQHLLELEGQEQQRCPSLALAP